MSKKDMIISYKTMTTSESKCAAVVLAHNKSETSNAGSGSSRQASRVADKTSCIGTVIGTVGKKKGSAGREERMTKQTPLHKKGRIRREKGICKE